MKLYLVSTYTNEWAVFAVSGDDAIDVVLEREGRYAYPRESYAVNEVPMQRGIVLDHPECL